MEPILVLSRSGTRGRSSSEGCQLFESKDLKDVCRKPSNKELKELRVTAAVGILRFHVPPQVNNKLLLTIRMRSTCTPPLWESLLLFNWINELTRFS